jgi:hypothetical protein
MIRRTQRRAAGLRHGLQHLVAGVVAVTVVDLFETVDVEEDDRHGGVGALGALELALRELDESASVEDARQQVRARQPGRFGPCPLQLLEHAQDDPTYRRGDEQGHRDGHLQRRRHPEGKAERRHQRRGHRHRAADARRGDQRRPGPPGPAQEQRMQGGGPTHRSLSEQAGETECRPGRQAA